MKKIEKQRINGKKEKRNKFKGFGLNERIGQRQEEVHNGGLEQYSAVGAHFFDRPEKQEPNEDGIEAKAKQKTHKGIPSMDLADHRKGKVKQRLGKGKAKWKKRDADNSNQCIGRKCQRQQKHFSFPTLGRRKKS
ncbi:hypothetical protein niasHT_008904 [Heterodera trifolii]|uniref:Uncharacterized protein n=1 Tax=Heterodera trifolii TaxID=157864 RepID=A0ABD2LY30_9BILA